MVFEDLVKQQADHIWTAKCGPNIRRIVLGHSLKYPQNDTINPCTPRLGQVREMAHPGIKLPGGKYC